MASAPEPREAELFEEGALSLRGASEFSGLSRSELYRLMDSSALAYQIFGRRRLVSRRSLVALIARGRERKAQR